MGCSSSYQEMKNENYEITRNLDNNITFNYSKKVLKLLDKFENVNLRKKKNLILLLKLLKNIKKIYEMTFNKEFNFELVELLKKFASSLSLKKIKNKFYENEKPVSTFKLSLYKEICILFLELLGKNYYSNFLEYYSQIEND